MRLHLYAKDVTSFAPDLTSPPDGYIWEIDYILTRLIAGSGTGTRQFNINIGGVDNTLGEQLVSTGSQTGASQTYYANFIGVSVASYVYYKKVVLDSESGLTATVILISGDTISYDIQLNQVIDE